MRQFKSILPSVIVLALFCVSASRANPASGAPDRTVRLAQAGSTGGALGDEEKSVSGAQSAPAQKKSATPRSIEKKPAVLRAPSPKPTRPVVEAPIEESARPPVAERRPKPRFVSLAAYDGVYSGASTGPCIPRWSWSFQVVNGIMTGESGSNISGAVNASGAAVGAMVVFGSTYNFSGRVTAAGASGTWTKHGPDGCSGTWSATK